MPLGGGIQWHTGMPDYMYTCVPVAVTERNGTPPLPTNDHRREHNGRQLPRANCWFMSLWDSEDGLSRPFRPQRMRSTHVVACHRRPFISMKRGATANETRAQSIVHGDQVQSVLPRKRRNQQVQVPKGAVGFWGRNVSAEGHWWNKKKTGIRIVQNTRTELDAMANARALPTHGIMRRESCGGNNNIEQIRRDTNRNQNNPGGMDVILPVLCQQRIPFYKNEGLTIHGRAWVNHALGRRM